MKADQINLLKNSYMAEVTKPNGQKTTLGSYVRICLDSDKDIVTSKECVLFDDANELVHAICVNEDMRSQADYPIKIYSADYAVVQEIETTMSQKNFETFLQNGYIANIASSEQIDYLKNWTRNIRNQAIQQFRPTPYYTESPIIERAASNKVKRDDEIEIISRPAKTASYSIREVSTAENLISNENNIILSNDITLDDYLTIDKTTGSMNINLNNHTLTINDISGITVESGSSLTITNGTLSLPMTGAAVNKSSIYVNSNSSINLENVLFTTEATGIYPSGNNAEVNIINSTVECGGYCITTNASTSDNYGVIININNSTITALGSSTPILVNVPCTVLIENSTINGQFHAVIVRGGDVTIKDSKIINIYEDDSLLNYFDNRDWGSGNTVNLAALTIGNKSSSYQYPSNVTLQGTTITSIGPYPTVYIIGNSGEGLGASLTYDDKCNIGDVVIGNEYTSVITA